MEHGQQWHVKEPEKIDNVRAFFPLSLSMSQQLENKSNPKTTQGAMGSNIEERGQEEYSVLARESQDWRYLKMGRIKTKQRQHLVSHHSGCHHHVLSAALVTVSTSRAGLSLPLCWPLSC